MTPKQIKTLDESIGRNTRWVNKKTKQEYTIEAIVLNCTNDREGRAVVIYSDSSTPCLFSRDYEEFLEKFTINGYEQLKSNNKGE